MLGQRYSPIGIDIRQEAVFGIQYRVQKHGGTLHCAASQPIEQFERAEARGPAVTRALKRLAARGFAGNTVIAAVPRPEADIRRIQMETSAEREFPRFLEEIQHKARQTLLYPPEEAVLDYLPLGSFTEDQKQCHMVMLISARRQHVVRHLDLISAAGLKCIHLDVTPCAVTRVFREQLTTAIIDIDLPCTVISVCQGANVLFSRTVRFGLQELIENLSTGLELSPADAVNMLRLHGIDHNARTRCEPEQIVLTGEIDEAAIPPLVFDASRKFFEHFAREVNRSFDYVMHQNHAIFGRGPWVGGPVEKVILLGSLLPAGFAEFLTDRIGMPVTVGNPFAAQAARGRGVAGHAAAYAVASGLALRSMAA